MIYWNKHFKTINTKFLLKTPINKNCCGNIKQKHKKQFEIKFKPIVELCERFYEFAWFIHWYERNKITNHVLLHWTFYEAIPNRKIFISSHVFHQFKTCIMKTHGQFFWIVTSLWKIWCSPFHAAQLCETMLRNVTNDGPAVCNLWENQSKIYSTGHRIGTVWKIEKKKQFNKQMTI